MPTNSYGKDNDMIASAVPEKFKHAWGKLAFNNGVSEATLIKIACARLLMEMSDKPAPGLNLWKLRASELTQSLREIADHGKRGTVTINQLAACVEGIANDIQKRNELLVDRIMDYAADGVFTDEELDDLVAFEKQDISDAGKIAQKGNLL